MSRVSENVAQFVHDMSQVDPHRELSPWNQDSRGEATRGNEGKFRRRELLAWSSQRGHV